MQRLVFSRRFARESITRNQALDVRRNLKLLENANTINQDKIPGFKSQGFFVVRQSPPVCEQEKLFNGFCLLFDDFCPMNEEKFSVTLLEQENFSLVHF